MKFLSKIDNEEQLVINNMPLVIKIAYKYKPHFPDDHDDLIQIGSIGLLKAIRCFDEKLGNQLSTLATISINREILKRLSKKKLVYDSLFDEEISEYNIEDCSTNYDYDYMLSNDIYSCLSDEEKKILYMRYYLSCTFAEIGTEFNKTKQWANLKIKEILEKIKQTNA